jgi:hypothetical protein
VKSYAASFVVALALVALQASNGVVAQATAGARTLPGTLVATTTWIEDCVDCVFRPAHGADLFVRTSGGRFHDLTTLQYRLGEGFAFGRRQSAWALPSLSPGGTAIALVNKRAEIVVRRINIDRQAVVGARVIAARLRRTDRLTNVAWSPGARSLVFAGRVQGQSSVWVAARDGSGARRILCDCDGTLPPHTDVYGVAWAPSERIAVLTADEDDEADDARATAYTVSARAADAKPIVTDALATRAVADMVYYDDGFRGPWWAPDGRLVFALSRLVAIDPATGQSTRLLKKDAHSPVWSPDGALVAYLSGETGSIRIAGARQDRRLHGQEIPGWIESLTWLRRPAPRARCIALARSSTARPGSAGQPIALMSRPSGPDSSSSMSDSSGVQCQVR